MALRFVCLFARRDCRENFGARALDAEFWAFNPIASQITKAAASASVSRTRLVVSPRRSLK